ncbi:MAG TPA: HAMP domain-containing sensor histidine kinase [Trueperaceae bacterium]|nr:HAMP domain-containing sensor histidine kinase [Trueperaceae bacterium]
MRLQLQLTLVFGVFIAIILSAFAVAVYVLTERSLSAGLEERAELALAELTSGTTSVSAGLLKLPSDTYYQILLVGRPGNLPTNVSAVKAGVQYRYNSNLLLQLPDSAVQTLIDTKRTAVSLSSGGDRLRVIGRMGTIRDAQTQSTFQAAFLVGIPAGLMASTLDQLARDLIATVLIAFMAFTIGIWVLGERVLAPLRKVTEAAAKVSGSDLSQRVPVNKGRDEIHDLGVAINNMLGRLQESFETQRRFTADASHELRTPVTAIAGHASYLVRRTNPSEEQIDSLTVIRREADRMGKLVNDLLELARADAGFTVNKLPVNVVEVAEQALKNLSKLPGGTSVELAAPSPLAEVSGDGERLKQVILNLVQNAINAGATRVNVAVTQEAKQVRVEVLDDGSGIPAEAVPHLFERFFRVDGARSGRGNGSGLGLAIVKWIVQQHDGTVTVESSLGEGTVFTVLLPLLDPRMTGETKATKGRPTDPGRTRAKRTADTSVTTESALETDET